MNLSSISSRSAVWLGWWLLCLFVLFAPSQAGASFTDPSGVIAPHSAPQVAAEWQLKLEIGTGLFCANDPINRHDPLGLADRNDALLQSDQFGNWLTYDQKQANILKTIGDLCGATWYGVKGVLPQAFTETKEGLPQAAFQMDAGMTKMAYENPVLAVPARPINWLAQGTLHLNPMILAGDVSLIADNGVGNTAKQWGRKIGNDVDRVFTERSLDSFLDAGEDVADVATLIEGGRGLLKTAGRALPTPWFALGEMEGVGMRLNPRAGIAGAINPQGDLLRRSAVQPGVITSDVVRFHHPWPKYLGGSLQQILEPLPKSLHDAFHSGLDKILARQVGTAYYENLSSAARTQMLQDLADYTKAFDKKNGTLLYEAMIREGFQY